MVDKESSATEKILAVVDLATGFGDEAKKIGKILGIADDVKDAKKTVKGARTEPLDLQEKLTLDEAKAGAGAPIMKVN